jgi:hypothetical protein
MAMKGVNLKEEERGPALTVSVYITAKRICPFLIHLFGHAS